jgi:hypothetical protein
LRLARRVDEDELGLLTRQANLDVAGRKLRVQLQRGLGEEVEELQPEVRAERVPEPPGDLGGPLVAELGQPLEILLQPFEYDRQIHDDVTMTSSLASVKHQRDMFLHRGGNPLQRLTQPQRGRPGRRLILRMATEVISPSSLHARATDRNRQWRTLADGHGRRRLTSPVAFTWFYLHQQLDFGTPCC